MAQRNFKGIWIDREIWLDNRLTIIEKCFIAEINSLDGDKGCYASNQYFSEFFGITKGRCSQIITTLKNKGFISVQHVRSKNGKNIEKRVLRILNRGIKYSKGGCLENAQENNTSINNTIDSSFDAFWEKYDKKIGRGKCLEQWKSLSEEDRTKITNTLQYYIVSTPDKIFRKNPSTYLKDKSWNDEIVKPNNHSLKRESTKLKLPPNYDE